MAIESNILISDGKVLFVQGTGGLTILDLKSGKVLLRRIVKDEYGYVSEILDSPGGVVLHSFRKATAVDAATMEPLWNIKSCNHPLIVGSYFVCHDGHHTVRCHDSITGEERWSKQLRGGWDLALSQRIVAVTTLPFYDGTPTVWAIDVESGEQLFQKAAPEGKQWCDVYCDKQFVYALTAPQESYDYKDAPDGIVKFDLSGNELEKITSSSSKVTKLHKTWERPFLFDGRAFPNQANIRAPYTHEQNTDSENPLLEDYEDSSLPSGLLKVFEQTDSSGKRGQLIQFIGMENSWKAYLPYCRPNEWLSTAQEADGKIIVASSGGQIECVDSKTGKPLWLYVFPSFRRILSYSDNYIGTYWRSRETTRANIFNEGLKSVGEKYGSITIPDGLNPEEMIWTNLVGRTQYKAFIILDPSPDLRFETLPSRVLLSKVVAVASVLGLAGILIGYWRNRAGFTKSTEDARHFQRNRYLLLLIASIGVTVLAAIGILFYGRVSAACTATYWAVVIVALLFLHKRMTSLSKGKSNILSYVLIAIWSGVLGILVASNAIS